MSHDSQIIFKQLLDQHNLIQIPMIQRDFAQGRPSESTVRDLFLKALHEALCKSVDDPTLPLNLDFIYGSVDDEDQNDTRFLPLDGQQRLTTLFLLHWYLAWRDEKWMDFEEIFIANKKTKFTYKVRPSSKEFFDQLVIFRPEFPPEDVSGQNDPITALITNQQWYFLSWRLDPTIQSVLHMLDAIHEKFVSTSGLFARLIDENHPAITFQLLELKDFGLSDDLYIKMNARGKPLTPFETFKSRFEEKLKSQYVGRTIENAGNHFIVTDYVSRRMDTTWTDLFWKLRNPNSHQFDDAFMNLVRAVALVTRNPDDQNNLDDESYLKNVTILRSTLEKPSYTDFQDRGWLDESFTFSLIHLLDSWSKQSGTLTCLLPNNIYFDEKAFFDKIAIHGASLSYTEIIQFAAYVKFIDKHYDSIDPIAFQEWMRIASNLSNNSIYNRVEDFRRSIRSLYGMLENAHEILNYFAFTEKNITGFYEPQLAEEKLKAKLILLDYGWRKRIDRAENHGYFRGQIGFLLDFCGAVSEANNSDPSHWDIDKQTTLQTNFDRYLTLAEKTFSDNGLNDLSNFRWQRALLTFGDYLLPRGRNHSFLVNTITDETSWKRLLRGTGTINPEPREFLKQLWDQLNANEDLTPQLERIINANHETESWREEMINCPSSFRYCEKNYIRKFTSDTTYLLKTTQLNGRHVELFTYCLYTKLIQMTDTFSIIKIKYSELIDLDCEPSLQLSGNYQGKEIKTEVLNIDGAFQIKIIKADFSKIPSFENALITNGYTEIDNEYQIRSSRSNIIADLKILDNILNSG